jgi:hypothetical protein
MVSMRFPMPHFPCEFEIPDDWIVEAGARDFVPRTAAYLPSAPANDAPLTQVEPPPRLSHVRLSWRGLDRERFMRVLRWMVESIPAEPVPEAATCEEIPVTGDSAVVHRHLRLQLSRAQLSAHNCP